MKTRKRYTINWGEHHLELGNRTCIMGVLNATPDSFSDGGRFFSMDDALAQGEQLVEDGADILDIGGESTRPFSDLVSLDEECRRVMPVIEALAHRISIPISIDTNKAEVARRAIDAGAAIINDISAFQMDPEMPKVAARCNVPVIVMHMLGTPKTMQKRPEYNDLLREIGTFLDRAIGTADKHGIPRSRVIIDPGIGFGKTLQHNLQLLRHLEEFASLDSPILVGTSRKAFIRKLIQGPSEVEPQPDSREVETGTQASVAAAILNGAHIVRVHDVANTRKTACIVDAILNAENPG